MLGVNEMKLAIVITPEVASWIDSPVWLVILYWGFDSGYTVNFGTN